MSARGEHRHRHRDRSPGDRARRGEHGGRHSEHGRTRRREGSYDSDERHEPRHHRKRKSKDASSSSLRHSKKRSHEHFDDVGDEGKGRSPDRTREERRRAEAEKARVPNRTDRTASWPVPYESNFGRSRMVGSPPGPAPAITNEDYFAKSAEFRLWLHEHKDLYFDKLSSELAHRYFKKFVRRWNDGKLEKKFYDGIRSSQVDPKELTSYKWKFKNESEGRLETIRAQIDRETNKDFAMEVKVRVAAQNHANGDVKHRPTQGPAMPPPGQPRQLPEDVVGEEGRAKYCRLLRNKADKEQRKTWNAHLEELVPKATGRDAIIEKRRAQTAYHRMERDDGMEVPDSVLMGGGDDGYQARLAAQKAREDRRQQRASEKREAMNEKVQSYNEKEAATIAMLRQLAEASRASGAGLMRSMK